MLVSSGGRRSRRHAQRSLFTIFAPANSAFAKIPAADLQALLADRTGALTDILTPPRCVR